MSNNGNERIARSIHLFLCDHVKWEKVLERVQTIKQQLKRTLEPVPSDESCYASEVCCAVCSNTDERTIIVDEQQGFKICLGSDGQGCGGVVEENMLKDSTYLPFVMDDAPTHELFSPQYSLGSQWVQGHTLYKRLNVQIERDLVKYNREDTMTSDLYKDKQRQEVYSLLDEVALHIDVHRDVVNNVKVLFHEYRSKMYRVHKLEVALVALFYIVLCG